MNERIYKTVDKTGWGDGPWQTEPDRIEWTDDNTGYPCVINRHERHGQLNGYVGLPFDHPCWGHDHDSIDVDVHGGLTYASQTPPPRDWTRADGGVEPDGNWWVGFDCGHYMDAHPGLDALLRSIGHEPTDLGIDIPEAFLPSYKPIEYVRQEVATLADQLASTVRTARKGS